MAARGEPDKRGAVSVIGHRPVTVFGMGQAGEDPQSIVASGGNTSFSMRQGSGGPATVLWDVDHTLLETGGVGRELYELAFTAATGQPYRVRAKITGRTELAILADTLALHDLPHSPAVVKAYSDELVKQYESHVDELRMRGRALSGARNALCSLYKEGFVQTVATGNLRGVTVVKLRTYDLHEYLDLTVGAYAEDGAERADLVKLALQRCRATYSAEAAHAVLIGDTPSDIHAAMACGIPVIGVATGRSDKAALYDAGAVEVFESLDDTGSIIARVKRLANFHQGA